MISKPSTRTNTSTKINNTTINFIVTRNLPDVSESHSVCS